MERIEGRHHPLVARCRQLARGRSADDQGWLLDGWHLVDEGLAAGLQFDFLALSARAGHEAEEAALNERARARGVRVVDVTPQVLEAMSPVRQPSGVVAVARPRAWRVEDLMGPGPALVLVACEVQDPGNLGAIVRAADAAGATGVIAAGASADPGSWKALRGAMGSAFRLPHVRASNVTETIADLTARDVAVLATVAREAPSIHATDLRRPVACLLGSEGSGLPPHVVAAAGARMTIPMRPGVESLNVATAAAVIAFEAWRQRHAG
jgi:TrmH family RNA methyltransferase